MPFSPTIVSRPYSVLDVDALSGLRTTHLRQLLDEFCCVRLLQRAQNLVVAERPVGAVGNIVANRHVEEWRLLRDNADDAAEIGEIQRVDSEAINFYLN